MSLAERVRELSVSAEAGVDVMTYVFRSDGYSDEEIRAAYDEVASSDEWSIEVHRQVPRFVRLTT